MAAAYKPVKQDLGVDPAAAVPQDTRQPRPAHGGPAWEWPWKEAGGIWNLITFGNMSAMLRRGQVSTLQMEDVPQLPKSHDAAMWADAFSHAWSQELQSPKAPSLWRVLVRLFAGRLLISILLSVMKNGLQLLNAYIMQLLITALGDPTSTLEQCLFLAAMLFGFGVTGSIIRSHGFQTGTNIGMNARTALVAALYGKVLRLDVNVSKGTIVTLFSTDANRIHRLAETLELAVTSPMVIIIGLGMLYNVIGWSILATVVVGGLLVPLNWKLSNSLHNATDSMTEFQQQRMKFVSEAMQGILAIKLLGWEHVAAERIALVRNKELAGVRSLSYALATFMTVIWSAGVAMAVSSLAMFAVTGGTLTAAVVFPCLYLFDYLMWPLLNFPMMSSVFVGSITSVRRIEEFLLRPEIEPVPMVQDASASTVFAEGVSFNWPNTEVSDAAASKQQHASNPVIQVANEDDDEEGLELVASQHAGNTAPWSAPVLHCVQLRVQRSELIAVVGRVGAGKSSLLMAFLGELVRDSNSIGVFGPVAYVPQQAWVRSMTVRNNILCGKPFVSKRYRDTIVACALAPDLKALKAGDMTEVGERGVTLSGGQKQRLSMARAVYADANVYLLDDPLSAVDARVGNWLFDRCICGMLRDKTRILVTHQVQFLPNVDRVVIMEDGRIAHVGTYAELVARGINFTSLSAHEQHTDDESAEGAEMSVEDLSGIADDDATLVGRLVEDEERFEGKVSATVYKNYFRSLGSMQFLGLFAFLSVAVEVARVGLQGWIAKWSAAAGAGDTGGFAWYLTIYVVIGATFTLLSAARNFSWFHSTYKASQALHERMLMSVLRAPMSFFHATPHGRILNRFSRDQTVIDQELPDEVSDTLCTGLELVSKLLLIIVVAPAFMGLFVPICLMYTVWTNRFRQSSRELKRLEAISFSPIQNLFAETVDGLASVRAFKQQSTEFHHMLVSQDTNNKVFLALRLSARWMSVRGQLCGALVILATTLLGSFGSKWWDMSPTMLALCISLAMSMTVSLDWFVRVAAQMEAEMSRVERLMHFTRLTPEASLDTGLEAARSRTPPRNWPAQGRVEFKDVVLQYRQGLPPALSGVSFVAQPGEKIGIVGRTGAGKSSLLMALFRVVELNSGSIIIDDIDVSTIGLRTLRQGICIIPQDPVLFAGTIRWNLDPLAGVDGRPVYDDATLWAALTKIGLRAFVSSLPGGLDHDLVEGASNLSVGQRQLLCLARALLRQAQILVMDEATASIDPESDALIQTTIRSEFQGRTVITIAHRLPTIIDYDRILVMDAGKVAEYDSASALLRNPSSLFFDMVAQTGPIASAFLHHAANSRAGAGVPPPMVRLRSLDSQSSGSVYSSPRIGPQPAPISRVPTGAEFDALVAAAASAAGIAVGGGTKLDEHSDGGDAIGTRRRSSTDRSSSMDRTAFLLQSDLASQQPVDAPHAMQRDGSFTTL